MTDDEVLQRLREVIRRSAPNPMDMSRVGLATTIAALNFDSLTVLDLIYDIQQEFKVDFEVERMATARTVGDVVALLRSVGV